MSTTSAPAGVATIVLLLTLATAGCAEPDLGDAPFFCNNGNPPCPENYVCQDHNGVLVCVRQGATYNKPDAKVAPQKDRGEDRGQVTFDGVKDTSPPRDKAADADLAQTQPDLPQQPDQTAPDVYPWPKDSAPKTDAPHLGCQSNNECKVQDKSTPCCCPTPLLPFIWSCWPICLNPFCIG